MSSMDAKAVTARLEADKSFATLFGILRDYGDLPASVWLEGEQEHSRTYTEVQVKQILYAFSRDLGCKWQKKRLNAFIESVFNFD